MFGFSTLKNVLLADVEETRDKNEYTSQQKVVKIRLLISSAGPKFWRSSKVIRAISNQDFQRLEIARSGQPGISGVYTRKPSPLIHVVSDTDSEDGFVH